MKSSSSWDSTTASWLLLLAGLVLRLGLSPFFQLSPDETNYWQWSRHLALGYYDHPPLLAWSIHVTTLLFGQNELAVRLPTNLGITITLAYMGLLGAHLFSPRIGYLVILLGQSLLVLNGSALIATPDGLLLPCWAGACYHAIRSLEENKLSHWLATGFWFGTGMLSKYTMGMFLPSLFFCCLVYKDRRYILLTWRPWIGWILALLLFSPVLFWNAGNSWVTFRHVLHQGGLNREHLITFRYIGDYLLSQMALISPLIFFMVLWAWFSSFWNQKIRRRDSAILILLSLPTFLVFLLLSLHTRVYGNWPSAGYITALLLITALYGPGRIVHARQGRMWRVAVIFSYAITLSVLIQTVYPILPVRVQLDRTARETKGWDQLAQAVQHHVDTMAQGSRPFIFGLRYQFASELAFYMPGQPETVSINRWTRPNVYDFWRHDQDLIGQDGVGVVEDQESATRLQEVFTRVDPPVPVTVHRISPWFGREEIATYYIVRGYGFQGGLRWQAQQTGDIRAVQ